MTKRTVDESLDNIARFFENVDAAVKKDNGVFMDDALLPVEVKAISRACASLAQRHRAEAEDVRRKEREQQQ